MRRLAALRFLASVNKWVCVASGAIAGALMLGMMVGGVADVVGRWVFDKPLAGAFELTQVALMSSVFLGFAYGELNDHHITVDLLYERVPRAAQVVLDVVAGALKALVVAVLTWQLVKYQGMLDDSNRTTTVLRIPQDQVLWAAVAGSCAFSVAIVARTIAKIAAPRDEGRIMDIGAV